MIMRIDSSSLVADVDDGKTERDKIILLRTKIQVDRMGHPTRHQ